jgi:hypothetical protein
MAVMVVLKEECPGVVLPPKGALGGVEATEEEEAFEAVECASRNYEVFLPTLALVKAVVVVGVVKSVLLKYHRLEVWILVSTLFYLERVLKTSSCSNILRLCQCNSYHKTLY